MGISIKDATRGGRLDTLDAALSTTAVIEVYAGAPTGKTGGTYNADPATKLVTFTLSNPAWPSSNTTGTANLSGTPISGTAIAGSGTSPGSVRFKTSASGAVSTVILEVDAGVGSGTINFSSAISSGNTVTLNSLSVTEGNA